MTTAATTKNTTYFDFRQAISQNRLLGVWKMMTGYRLTYIIATFALAISALAKTCTYLLLAFFTDQALKDRAMLAVDRQHARATAARRFHEQISGRHDQLLVGHRDVDAAGDRRKYGFEGHRTIGRGEHELGVALNCYPHQSFGTVGGAAYDRRPELLRLTLEQVDVAARRQTDDDELLRVLADYVECLRTNRSGRAQNRDALALAH